MNKKLWKILVRAGVAVCCFMLMSRDGLKGKQTPDYTDSDKAAYPRGRSAAREGDASLFRKGTLSQPLSVIKRDAPQSDLTTVIAKTLPASGFSIKKITAGKIFTPNGDDWNKYFEIQYENLGDAIISAKIYDIKGRYVSAMTNDQDKEVLRWDGKDIKGKLQRGGVYIYQIDVSGYETTVIKGTVVLAR
ncbi:gliding motility-associated C-terminal domain-containing protein [bacterium]|nr:gliding motility-associated C-terminal domain-containing protein [bacterium]